MTEDDDATIRIPRPVLRQKPSLLPWIGAAAAVVLLGGGGWGAWYVTHPTPLPAPVLASAPAVIPAMAPAAPPAPALPPLATEAEILANRSNRTEEYRFAPQPQIIVLQFATLAEQADALNRVAALLEKSGFPRDQVVDAGELTQRITAAGGTAETFYYGHDYRAADLLRFFAEAERSRTPLTAGEAQLRQRIAAWGWRPDSTGALISLVQANQAAGVDDMMRATILRHELSHGLYFTSPDYARYTRQFWDGTLTAAERSNIRRFLDRDGYDVSIDDLVVNESQAYLVHTTNPQFFTAQSVGMTEQRLALLRGLFVTGMPPGWLRDCTLVPRRRRRQTKIRVLRSS